jgi:hypothetical protein
MPLLWEAFIPSSVWRLCRGDGVEGLRTRSEPVFFSFPVLRAGHLYRMGPAGSPAAGMVRAVPPVGSIPGTWPGCLHCSAVSVADRCQSLVGPGMELGQWWI